MWLSFNNNFVFFYDIDINVLICLEMLKIMAKKG